VSTRRLREAHQLEAIAAHPMALSLFADRPELAS
jgi:hypothetical protein